MFLCKSFLRQEISVYTLIQKIYAPDISAILSEKAVGIIVRSHCLRRRNRFYFLHTLHHKAVRRGGDVSKFLNTVLILFLRGADSIKFFFIVRHIRDIGNLFPCLPHCIQGRLRLVLGQFQFLCAETDGQRLLLKGIDLHRHFGKGLSRFLHCTLQFILRIRLIGFLSLVEDSLCRIQDSLQSIIRVCDSGCRFIEGGYGCIIFPDSSIIGFHCIGCRRFRAEDSVCKKYRCRCRKQGRNPYDLLFHVQSSRFRGFVPL